MLESLYRFSLEDGKSIEQLINDDDVQINHVVLPRGEGLPEHYSNSHVYLIVVRGAITIRLGEQEPSQYCRGEIISVPYHTKMNINNFGVDSLEFFIVKAPHPRKYDKG